MPERHRSLSGDPHPLYPSSLNLVSANRYIGLQMVRLRATTTMAITMVAAKRRRKLPESVAWLIAAPNPTVEIV
jgi:hypothetical protein